VAITAAIFSTSATVVYLDALFDYAKPYGLAVWAIA
jgi:hypothetical protein